MRDIVVVKVYRTTRRLTFGRKKTLIRVLYLSEIWREKRRAIPLNCHYNNILPNQPYGKESKIICFLYPLLPSIEIRRKKRIAYRTLGSPPLSFAIFGTIGTLERLSGARIRYHRVFTRHNDSRSRLVTVSLLYAKTQAYMVVFVVV